MQALSRRIQVTIALALGAAVLVLAATARHCNVEEVTQQMTDPMSTATRSTRRDRMVRPTLKVDSRPEWSWQTHELSETGALGNPSLASAELGEKLWDTWAEPVALFLRRLWEEPLDS